MLMGEAEFNLMALGASREHVAESVAYVRV
jgi:hypothetical protein